MIVVTKKWFHICTARGHSNSPCPWPLGDFQQHWGNLAVYDSKFKGGDLSSSLTHQLALIYRLLAEREDVDGDEIDPPILHG